MRTPLIMLNELDSLSENINRLLQSLESSRGALAERDGQLARARVERDEALTTNRALRAERDALREECDSLLAKIEDAQIKLNAILEKLPRPRTLAGDAADGGTNVDSAQTSADTSTDTSANVASHTDEQDHHAHSLTESVVDHAAAHAHHAEGETYER